MTRLDLCDAQLEGIRTWEGQGLGEGLKSRLKQEWERVVQLREQIPIRVSAYNNRISGERTIGAVTLALTKVADDRLRDTDEVLLDDGQSALYSSRASVGGDKSDGTFCSSMVPDAAGQLRHIFSCA